MDTEITSVFVSSIPEDTRVYFEVGLVHTDELQRFFDGALRNYLKVHLSNKVRFYGWLLGVKYELRTIYVKFLVEDTNLLFDVTSLVGQKVTINTKIFTLPQ